MIKVENIKVYGFEPAIYGMRSPMNSWNRSDSYSTHIENLETMNEAEFEYFVGDNDLNLMQRLFKAGTEHRKYDRMIRVWMDITAPLYWWKEYDTYKVGTVANSCSTMHKIHFKRFEREDFSIEHIHNFAEEHWMVCMDNIISSLNVARDKYLETNDKEYWWQMIQLLPSSYNQKRTVMLNYEVAIRIIKQRSHHKLDEWVEFVEVLRGLP